MPLTGAALPLDAALTNTALEVPLPMAHDTLVWVEPTEEKVTPLAWVAGAWVRVTPTEVRLALVWLGIACFTDPCHV